LIWGQDVDFLQKRIEAGQRAPALENRPSLYEDLDDVWDLFWQLHGCRQYGVGPCPLSVTDIVNLLDLCQITGEQKMEYFQLIKIMDRTWLSWASEQAKT